MALLMCCKGWDYATAAREVEKIVGEAEEAKPKQSVDRNPRERLLRIQEKLKPAGEAVRAYLAARGLEPVPAIRQARLPYWKDGRMVGEFDAMVARVVGADGKPLTFHVTYLKDGKKAPVDPSRKLMTPVAPINGGCIRLMPAAAEMGIAEGIETALAASVMYSIPVWSCVSEALLQAFEPPAIARKLWVFGDHDENYTGQAAAYACAKRITKRGIECDVHIPPMPGDWNDVLLASRREAA